MDQLILPQIQQRAKMAPCWITSSGFGARDAVRSSTNPFKSDSRYQVSQVYYTQNARWREISANCELIQSVIVNPILADTAHPAFCL